jgi:hypothetical protein
MAAGLITDFGDAINAYFGPEHFVRRPWLESKVSELGKGAEQKHLILVGEPGSGKSALIAYLATSWNCPRYFIRVDSIRGISGLSARSFLISVGTQLYQRYGAALFERSSPSVKVVTGVTGGRAEIIGRYVDQLYTLPFLPMTGNVHVRSGVALDNARVVGEFVREVHDSMLSVDEPTLLELVVLAPLRRLLARAPDERVFLLVDAIDEAAGQPGTSILNVIPRVNDAGFPSNLRIVITSRPGDHLVGFRQQDFLRLEEHAQLINEDVRSYIDSKLLEPEFASVVAAIGPSDTDQLISQIQQSSAGNFLYLHHFFNELRQHVAKGNRVATIRIPKGLDEVYRYFAVEKIKGAVSLDDWEQTYLPLLGTLAVLREPVHRRLLAALAGVAVARADYVASSLQQFLRFEPTPAGNRVGLYHNSFKDYLLDSRRNRDWPLDGPVLHGRVADHFRPPGTRWADVEWSGQPEDYPFRHLAAHLLEGKRHDDLHELLATGTKEIRWALAHYERYNSYAGYLGDLELAFDAVLESHNAISRCARYLLIATSIRSVTGNFGTELLYQLGVTKAWPWNRVFGHLHQVDDFNRGEILRGIIPRLPGEAFFDLLSAISLVRDESARASMFEAISMRFRTPWQKSAASAAVGAVDRFRNPAHKARALASLISAMPADMRPDVARRALQASNLAPVSPEAQDAWRAVLRTLPKEIATEAIEIASIIENEWHRGLYLAETGCCVDDPSARVAIAHLRAIKNPSSRIRALSLFLKRYQGPIQPSVPRRALLRTVFLKDAYDRVSCTIDLIPALRPRWRSMVAAIAMAFIPTVKWPGSRARLHIELLKYLPAHLIVRSAKAALSLTNSLDDYQLKFALLRDLTRGAPSEVAILAARAALAASEEMRSDIDRGRTLVELSSVVPIDFSRELISYLQGIREENLVCRTFVALVPRLATGILTDIEALILGIEHDIDRGNMLAALGQHISAEYREWALLTASAIFSEYWRADALGKLLFLLPDNLPFIRDAVVNLKEDQPRATGLINILRYLPTAKRGPLVEATLLASRRIEFTDVRSERLSQLVALVAPNHRPSLIKEALAAAMAVNDGRAVARGLIAFYRNLLPPMRSLVVSSAIEALKHVGGKHSEHWIAGELITGTAKSDLNEQRAILRFILSLEPRAWHLLYQLVANVNDELVPELVNLAEGDDLNFFRLKALARLCDRLPRDERRAKLIEGIPRAAAGVTHYEAYILVDLPEDALEADNDFLWKRVLATAGQSQNKDMWPIISRKLPARLATIAIAALPPLADDQGSRARIVYQLASKLDWAVAEPLIRTAFGGALVPIVDEDDITEILAEVVCVVPIEAIPDVIAATARIRDPYRQISSIISLAALAASMPIQSELARSAFAAIKAEGGRQVSLLAQLGPLLPDDLVDQAFELLDSIEPRELASLAYAALGVRTPNHPRLPSIGTLLDARRLPQIGYFFSEITANAAAMTTGLQHAELTREALLRLPRELFPTNRYELYSRVVTQWSASDFSEGRQSGRKTTVEALRALTLERRLMLFKFMSSLSVPIAHFGGQAAVAEVFASTVAASRWWP